MQLLKLTSLLIFALLLFLYSSRIYGVASEASTNSSPGDSFASTHNLPPTLSGQFWLQPAICTSVVKHCNPINAQIPPLLMPLETGLLWDLVSSTPFSHHSHDENLVGPEQMAKAVASLPILKHVLEVTMTTGSTAYDFHEWSSSTNDVSCQLLHLVTEMLFMYDRSKHL